jgi:hypothetical protein
MSEFYFVDISPYVRFDKDRPGSRDWYRLMRHIGPGAEYVELDFLPDPLIANTLAYRRNAGL